MGTGGRLASPLPCPADDLVPGTVLHLEPCAKCSIGLFVVPWLGVSPALSPVAEVSRSIRKSIILYIRLSIIFYIDIYIRGCIIESIILYVRKDIRDKRIGVYYESHCFWYIKRWHRQDDCGV